MKENFNDFKEKEWYRERIIEMVREIKRTDILYSIYIFVSDIEKEEKEIPS